MIHDVLKLSWNVPRPPKPNSSPFSVTKIILFVTLIFVTDSIATSHNGDMKDDVAVDLTVMWIAMMT